jgi:SAM-dependent methyltransferase
MKSSQIRVLDKSQVESFDTEYVNEEMWSTLQMILNERETIIGSSFSFLDIGGGNGKFTDRILSVFSESHGCLADNPRKTVIEVNVEEIKTLFPEQKFDIIFMNWVLHHFVKGGYRTTMRTQVDILTQAKDLLSKNGRIIVLENLPDGLFGETVCSFIINRVTSSKIFAPIVKKMGGNTAGVGICFLGERQWSKQFLLAGLRIEKITKFAKWSLNPIKKIALTIKSIRARIFVVSAKL